MAGDGDLDTARLIARIAAPSGAVGAYAKRPPLDVDRYPLQRLAAARGDGRGRPAGHHLDDERAFDPDAVEISDGIAAFGGMDGQRESSEEGGERDPVHGIGIMPGNG